MVERKVATVLFADLVDSTGLVASADPEVVRRRVERYFDVVASRIEAYGGTVEKFAGDAVMAAFGVPIAHEDDAERAVRAALEIVPKVEELQLSVRIGVESGEIVIGDSDSTFATGEAVNLAVASARCNCSPKLAGRRRSSASGDCRSPSVFTSGAGRWPRASASSDT